jgi:hypothetical protein
MFTVQGFDPGGVAYGVSFEDGAEPALKGSPNAIALLAGREGEEVLVTPTGPTVTVDLTDGTAVLGALMGLTTVTAAEGEDLPEVFEPAEPGAIH